MIQLNYVVESSTNKAKEMANLTTHRND